MKKALYPSIVGILSSNIPPSKGINISGVNPIMEINPVAVPVTTTGIPPSSSKA